MPSARQVVVKLTITVTVPKTALIDENHVLLNQLGDQVQAAAERGAQTACRNANYVDLKPQTRTERWRSEWLPE